MSSVHRLGPGEHEDDYGHVVYAENENRQVIPEDKLLIEWLNIKAFCVPDPAGPQMVI